MGLFAFANRKFLFTDQLYYDKLGEQLTAEQIQYVIASQNVWWKQIIGYAIIPLIVIIRVLYTAFCLHIGNLVQEYRWKFSSLYNISLKADAVFCLNSIFNFYYYAFIQPPQAVDDLSVNFLSLLRLTGKKNIPDWLIFAYNSINIFELMYVILLIMLVKTCFKINYWKSIVFVFLTYCIGNYLYIVGLTFLYLYLS
ncbi:MAG: hypothetical protein LBG92_10390 [Prevotellaceae bacterium]|jgi:hypothetical protein|nr:hypothetical protein [Prevotellaceae bacterium]